jgi:hypothetical protein
MASESRHWLLGSATALAVGSAVAYVVGRLYLQSYYAVLGVPSSAYGTSPEGYIFSSFGPLYFPTLLCGIVLGVRYVSRYLSKSSEPLHPLWAAAWVIPIWLFVLSLSWYVHKRVFWTLSGIFVALVMLGIVGLIHSARKSLAGGTPLLPLVIGLGLIGISVIHGYSEAEGKLRGCGEFEQIRLISTIDGTLANSTWIMLGSSADQYYLRFTNQSADQKSVMVVSKSEVKLAELSFYRGDMDCFP